MKIEKLTIDRYAEVVELFKRTLGVSVRAADSMDSAARYLARNPRLSFIAENDGVVIGCAMCGHDARREYLQHVVVDPPFRGRGITHALITRCLDCLEEAGIVKKHIDVFVSNYLANEYLMKAG